MSVEHPVLRPLRLALLSASAVASIVGCGAGTPRSSHPSTTIGHAAETRRSAGRARHVTISISNYAFAPARIVVAAGGRITFLNHDPTPHTATTTSAGFDSGTLRPHQHRTLTLSHPGTYHYLCQFHPFMHGVILVGPR